MKMIELSYQSHCFFFGRLGQQELADISFFHLCTLFKYYTQLKHIYCKESVVNHSHHHQLEVTQHEDRTFLKSNLLTLNESS